MTAMNTPSGDGNNEPVFQPVSTRVNFPQMEEEVLDFWRKDRTFKKSQEKRKGGPKFTFYEGPPTANGKPHIGHVLTRVFKDIFPRYKTMRGYEVLARWSGWDCHGLPVEIEVEKELGFSGKQAIEEYGVAKFNQKCRESVFRYINEWREMSERVGFWIDLDGGYITLNNEYIETVWWILKQIWEKDALYQGYRVAPYCPRCGTTLSSHEVNLGYQTVKDPSIYVKFQLADGEAERLGLPADRPVHFLVWTTTPWTLPGNAALALSPSLPYVLVEHNGDYLILAKELLEGEHAALQGEYTVLQELDAKTLEGTRYKQLFPFVGPENGETAFVVALAGFVTSDTGTGIVHIAPAFGEDDMALGRKLGLPVLQPVNGAGKFVDAVTPWAGLFVKEADPQITAELRRTGRLYRSTLYEHEYPFCWRCKTPLLYYATTSWFVKRQAYSDEMLRLNESINWYPEYIKNGRFGNFVASIIDWNLSRTRYWGTPLPVWICENEDCKHQHVVGSIAELREMAVSPVPEGLDLHRPFVDDVLLRCPKDGGTMHRVPEVIDTWFDSGSMPYGQWHYPFENKEQFELSFPADFISEAIDQTRGWFLSLHVLGTLLFDSVAFKNVICLEFVVNEQKKKISKSERHNLGWELALSSGADASRWLLLTQAALGQQRAVSTDLMAEVLRSFLLTIWNTYSFFVTYANIDGFRPTDVPLEKRSTLDRWIVSELNNLVKEVTTALDQYDPPTAGRSLEQFVDNLSNWYVRRSRRRFWKSQDDVDKLAAYQTLYECLTTLVKLLAPFVPFTTEKIYRNLVLSVDPNAPESVHLCDWPEVNEAAIDPKLMADTRLAKRVVSLGRAARMKAQLKVRQPVSEMVVWVRTAEEHAALEALAPQVLEELNVKQLTFANTAAMLVNYTVKPNFKLLGPKYGKQMKDVQNAVRGLNPAEVAQLVREGQSVQAGEFTLLPEELEVTASEKPGYVVAEEGGYLVALDKTVTPELLEEGLARELVHRIQNLRKTADANLTDRIVTYYLGDEVVQKVMQKFAEYIKSETLSVDLLNEQPPVAGTREEADVDGHEVMLAVVVPAGLTDEPLEEVADSVKQ